jgi:hypothetical protein
LLCPLLENILSSLGADALKAIWKKLRLSRDPSHTCQSALSTVVKYGEGLYSFVLKEFDQSRKVSSYVPYIIRESGLHYEHHTDLAVPIHPFLFLTVTNTLPDHEVQLAPYIAVHLVRQEPIPDHAHCLIFIDEIGAYGAENSSATIELDWPSTLL